MPVKYGWWPEPPLRAISIGDRATFHHWVASAAIVGGVFCIPVVREATGVPPRWALGLMALHVVWSAFVVFVLTKPKEGFRSRSALDVGMAGNLLVNTFICVAFCVVGKEPKTPLWMLPTLYATLNGNIPETRPSRVILGVHVLAPLATIPIFRAGGDTTNWSIAAPLLCSAVSAAAYHAGAMSTARYAEDRAERDAIVAELRAKLGERDRTRLAQDLHDSLGSVLGVVALYGDLIERSCEKPDELRSIASMVREATREGLTDLRSVIGAIAPASSDVKGVARALRPIVERAASASGAEVDLVVEGEGAAAIDGPARLAIVRVFQEALANALKHGRAKKIRVVLRVKGTDLELDVSDDGAGFDVASVATRAEGRGLRGMRDRIEELGGSFRLDSEPGRGTMIVVQVPRSA